MKFIFIGTPDFGALILSELIKSDYKPVLVVTETDKPVGRKHIITPPPVKIIAQENNIPVLQPEKIFNLRQEILNLTPDLIIVAAYGQIIPKEILDIPKYGTLNVHPSLLPKYRGPSPIQSAILNGDTETGVTIMLLDDKMDHGPIIANAKFKNQNVKLTYEELHGELAKLGAELLTDIIPKWVAGEITPQTQDEKMATYTKMLKKEDGRINWTESAAMIDRKVRALNPWPGAFTRVKEGDLKLKTLKIWKAAIKEQTTDGPFGIPGKTFMATNEQIAVQAGKNFLIIEELQLEGGKRMKVEEFLNGHPDFIGTVFI